MSDYNKTDLAEILGYDYENDPNAFETATLDFYYDQYFKGEQGHTYTDKEISISTGKTDIDDCLAIMKTILYRHFGISEPVENSDKKSKNPKKSA